jgi:hypothetical protein
VVAVENTENYRPEALAGLKKLAFEPVNDAVRLMCRLETLTDREIAKLSLLAVSEIKRLKDGALEIKFFDRLKAFELLAEYTASAEDASAASSFYGALESAAKAARDADAL